MIHQDASPDFGGRMNVDGKGFRDAILEMQRQKFSTLSPEPMGDAISRQGVHSFQEQEWHQTAFNGRVTFPDSSNIRADGVDNRRIPGHGFLNHFSQLHGCQSAGGQFSRQVEADRVFKAIMVKDGRVQKTGSLRLDMRLSDVSKAS
jgi:hypothetical protein